MCYGETSLVNAAGEIKDLSQMSDAQPDSPVYEQIRDWLGGGSSADSGGLDTGGEDGEHTGESGETGGER
jgi:transcription initiation factor TFIID subunit TAF12